MNGIKVPFTIGIQTLRHNGLVYMDAMFGTNDVKYHLFTLMAFDFHCTWVLVVWVIKNWQTCRDLVKRLNALRAKFLSHMPHWKPSCSIVDDTPNIAVSCTLIFIFLLYYLVFWYYVNMGIP